MCAVVIALICVLAVDSGRYDNVVDPNKPDPDKPIEYIPSFEDYK